MSLYTSTFNVKVILYESNTFVQSYDIASEALNNFKKDSLHVLTDANVLVLIDTDQSIFVNGRFSLPSDIHRPITYA